MSLIIEKEELKSLFKRSAAVAVDCRSENEFNSGHLPGAVNFPAHQLIDRNSEKSSLKSWSQLAEELGRAGVSPALEAGQKIVMYDDSGLVPSARLLWVLAVIGVRNTAVLNGGFYEWKQSYPESVSNEIQPDSPGKSGDPLKINLDHSIVADKDEILEILNDANSGIVIIDARNEGEYRGEIPGALRNGHIPGAQNINWEEHVQDLLIPRIKTPGELKELYSFLPADPNSRIIVYCRSGNRSTHSHLVLRQLGYTNVANYPGSWLEWGNESDLPVETHFSNIAN